MDPFDSTEDKLAGRAEGAPGATVIALSKREPEGRQPRAVRQQNVQSDARNHWPMSKSSKGEVSMYCLGSYLIEEARDSGFHDLARDLEGVFGGFLRMMPRAQQAEALQVSYELAMSNEETVCRPQLRLVHSRD